MSPCRSAPRRCGFTLVELLVVVLIVVLVSAVTLPAVISSLSHREVSESARILQAALVGARDAAIRSNSPRGIRLLPDPVLNRTATNASGQRYSTVLAYNRFVPIEPAGDYRTGRLSAVTGQYANAPPYSVPFTGTANYPPQFGLILEESLTTLVPGAPPTRLPNERTSWFWNVRVGDRVRLNATGRVYTVVGPLVVHPHNPDPTLRGNPELFVNIGRLTAAGGAGPSSSYAQVRPYIPAIPTAEADYLYVVNGQDDDADGFIDDGWDGFDNNYDGVKDDPAEWEGESLVGTDAKVALINVEYVIRRRPVPTQGAREVSLPSGVVIDATSWDLTRERSRLPIDPNTLGVDVMLSANGQVVPTTLYSAPTASGQPFYHFWLAERPDVHEIGELWGLLPTQAPKPNPGATATPPRRFLLPLPAPAYPAGSATTALKGERRLVTLFVRTGNIVVNSVEDFDPADVNAPFYAAQTGVREAK